jgi:hypothetical protein
MDLSSTVRRVTSQRVTHRENAAPADLRAYRRARQHLYPLEDYQDALAVGGAVCSFCGIEVALLGGDTSDVIEAIEPVVEDCVTCVDIWRERRLVRL